jgi:hypothetical protein
MKKLPTVCGMRFNLSTIKYYKDENGCWICVSHRRNPAGYPVISVNRTAMTLVRLIAKLKYENLPSDIFICHKCDNPNCINPEHLYFGTHEDNMRDKADRHRVNTVGERNPNRKLSRKIVDEIRRLYKETVTTHRQLAKKFNLSKSQITRIINKHQWKEN